MDREQVRAFANRDWRAIAVAWDRSDMTPLLAALRADEFELRPAPPDFIERTRVVPLVHRSGIQTGASFASTSGRRSARCRSTMLGSCEVSRPEWMPSTAARVGDADCSI
jgi:hypothetical protein